jgi:hypothetical protein
MYVYILLYNIFHPLCYLFIFFSTWFNISYLFGPFQNAPLFLSIIWLSNFHTTHTYLFKVYLHNVVDFSVLSHLFSMYMCSKFLDITLYPKHTFWLWNKAKTLGSRVQNLLAPFNLSSVCVQYQKALQKVSGLFGGRLIFLNIPFF